MRKWLLFGILLILSISSCKKKEPVDKWTDTMRSGIIDIAADKEFKNLMDAEIQAFENFRNFQAIVNPIYKNEKEAIALMTEDSVRFVLATRGLTAAEKAKMDERQMKVRQHLIAFDGIALLLNTANPDSTIGLESFKKILTGEITEWSQLYENTHLDKIRVIFNDKESSVLRYITDSIIPAKDIKAELYALDSSLEVMQKVAEMPNTIGVLSATALASSREKLENPEVFRNIKLMRVGQGENPLPNETYLPYAGDINKENYPLWRPVYVLLSDPRSGLSSGLSIFMYDEIGQKIVLQQELLPVKDPHILKIRIVDSIIE